MRSWRSDRPAKGPEREGEISTCASVFRELERSADAAASALRCSTAVSHARRSALSWDSSVSR